MSCKTDASLYLVVALLLACYAAPRAATQTERPADEGEKTEQKLPRTELENVEFEFEGNETFTTEELVD